MRLTRDLKNNCFTSLVQFSCGEANAAFSWLSLVFRRLRLRRRRETRGDERCQCGQCDDDVDTNWRSRRTRRRSSPWRRSRDGFVRLADDSPHHPVRRDAVVLGNLHHHQQHSNDSKILRAAAGRTSVQTSAEGRPQIMEPRTFWKAIFRFSWTFSCIMAIATSTKGHRWITVVCGVPTISFRGIILTPVIYTVSQKRIPPNHQR